MIKDIDKDYLQRLIADVRLEIAKNMRDTFNGPAIPSNWISAALLCDVVEKELLQIDTPAEK